MLDAGIDSTIRPAYSTITSSQIARTVLRSWLMNM